MQKEEEEVPYFSTIFYDKEKKMIVKITEKRVETGGQSRKMIIDKTVVYGTYADPRLIARVGVALTKATENNVDRLMTDLEQYKKNAAQLKETLKKERDEGHMLKRKFEDMQNELRTSKTELQTLEANKEALEVSAGKMEKDAQNSLAELQRL